MEKIDLNIKNYDLDDILKLFHLDYNFGEEELKKVYKIVLKTHPDKSNLDKKYFIFYSKAFKKLKEIYDYKTKYLKESKNEKCVSRQNYNNNVNDGLRKDEIKNILEKEDFNEWFNKMFDKVKLEDEENDKGYGDWLKKSEPLLEKAHNVSMMNELINQRKVESRNNVLAKYNGIQDLHSGIGVSQSSILRDELEEYSSDMFSKLQYEDLKKAHTETVIPVTDEDYHNKEKYSSVDDLKRRRMESGRLISEREAKEKLRNNELREHKNDMYRSYKMMKQMEAIENSNKLFYASLKQIQN